MAAAGRPRDDRRGHAAAGARCSASGPSGTGDDAARASLEQSPRLPRTDSEDARAEHQAGCAEAPSVAGILKLRAATSGPLNAAPHRRRRLPVNEEVATDDVDADLEWAKEILAATGGRR